MKKTFLDSTEALMRARALSRWEGEGGALGKETH